jgi:hypothetical protein
MNPERRSQCVVNDPPPPLTGTYGVARGWPPHNWTLFITIGDRNNAWLSCSIILVA